MQFQSEIFNRTRADCPETIAKVFPVEGDITIDDLGLSEENLQRVLEEVGALNHPDSSYHQTRKGL